MKNVSMKAGQVMINALDNKVNENTDSAISQITETTKTALEGSIVEKMEANEKLNALMEVIVNPKVQENLGQVIGRYGQTHNIDRSEAAIIEKYEHELRGARKQAEGSDVRFGRVSKENVSVGFENISAGFACDYRDLVSDATGFLKDYVVELMTSMDNSVVEKVVTDLTSNIKTASTNGEVVYYASGNGISQTALNEAVKQVRRSGEANIFGDYSVVTQLEDFVGFKTDAYLVLAEQRLLEIDNQGYIAKYRGSNVTEIKNALNFYDKKFDNAATFKNTYGTILPESDLFVMANGKMSPNHIFFRGGLTTQKGSNVSNGTEEQRWDLSVGTHFVGERAYMLGLIQDSDLI